MDRSPLYSLVFYSDSEACCRASCYSTARSSSRFAHFKLFSPLIFYSSYDANNGASKKMTKKDITRPQSRPILYVTYNTDINTTNILGFLLQMSLLVAIGLHMYNEYGTIPKARAVGRRISTEDYSIYNFWMLWCQAMDKAEDSHVKQASSRPLLSIRQQQPDAILLFCRPSPRPRMI